ncbi:hypothetical protein CALCODRAFT_489537 [Calocera cornea HHB12733]|uniref:Uncharacterized protein n=1 Tax=Calocera cornea HHB12733 TaxID=1353952 RepID=A0A165KDB9_9BASI|nr:hypothetical protein CALCODRAFT_489537 [Calocera cornea HHB12733]
MSSRFEDCSEITPRSAPQSPSTLLPVLPYAFPPRLSGSPCFSSCNRTCQARRPLRAC